MNKENEGYKTAFKTTALFGGVQVVVILVSVLKSKLISVWLGPLGMGIMTLFNSAISLISSVTNLGIQSSAVRDIAEAETHKEPTLTARVVKSVSRWVIWTGLGGALITIILSPWLSEWTFKNDDYVVSFIFLSAVVLLTGIFNGHYAVLQGTRNLKLLALANVYGALAGFVCSIPIFYLFRNDGIVWALILTALSTLAVSYFFVRKVQLVVVKQTYKESARLGLKTVKLGIAMAISGIAVLLVQYAVQITVEHLGGTAEVGIYHAGWAINATYLGMVFTAMAKDYFPRLSLQSSNDSAINTMVNQQAEIAILLLAPMIIVMMVFLSFFIALLYSNEFLGAVPMTKWLLIGSLIKSGSWSISFVFLAKGNGKLFLFNELGIKFITLPLYLLGYYCFGLIGIGYAFSLNYVFYFLWVSIVAYRKYKLTLSGTFWRMFLLLLTALLLFPIGEELWSANYITGIALILAVSVYSLYALNKRIDIKETINKFRHGRK